MDNLSKSSLMLVSYTDVVEKKIEKGVNAGKVYYQVKFNALPTNEQLEMQKLYGAIISMPHATRNIFDNMQQFNDVKALFETGDKTAKRIFFAELYPSVSLDPDQFYHAKNTATGIVTENVVKSLSNILVLAGESVTSRVANLLRSIGDDQRIKAVADSGANEPISE